MRLEEQEKKLQEIVDLLKKTDPVAVEMVMQVARDCARLYPAKTKKVALRLVS
jgi:hypothetical protein